MQKESLELPNDFSLSIDMDSFLFDEDLTSGSFTIPVEIPWSSKNKRILGNPEMLETLLKDDSPNWIVDILSFGMPELLQAKMTLLKNKGKFDYSEGAYSVTITGGESIFGYKIKNKTLKDLTLTGIINFPNPTDDSRTFANNFMHGSYPQWQGKIAFAPIHWLGYIDDTRSDFDNESLTSEIVNNIVIGSGIYKFGVPNPSNPAAALSSGSTGYMEHRTIPFFNLFYVIKQAFTENGYTINGNIFNDPDLSKIFLVNNRSIEVYRPSFNVDQNRRIVPSDHMQLIEIPILLTSFCNAFNLGLWYKGGKTFEFISKNNLSAVSSLSDISEYCLDQFEEDCTPILSEGAKITFNFDSSDSLIGDRVKEINPEILRGTFSNYSVLTSTSFTNLKNGDLAYVTAENYYFYWDSGFGKWSYFSEAQQSKTIGDGSKELKTDLSPLLQGVGINSNGTVYSMDMCEISQQGSYFTNSRVLTESTMGLRMCFIDQFTKSGVASVPVSFTHNTTANGNLRGNTSLSYVSNQGLFGKCFDKWINMQLKSRTITAFFKFPVGFDIYSLLAEPVILHHSKYYIKYYQKDLSNGTMQVDLVHT